MTTYGQSINPSMKDVVIEKFVGSASRPEFVKIEKELKKVIAKINRDYKPLITRLDEGSLKVDLNTDEINKMPEVRNIERMFKEIFGLREFVMHWQSSSTSNAYTMCKSYMFLDKNYVKDAKGHRTNKNLFIGVNIYSGIVTYSNMNEKEVLAILLHEIGHNFYNSIFHTLSFMPLTIMKSLKEIGTNIIDHLFVQVFKDIIDINEFQFSIMTKINIMISRKFPKVASTMLSVADIYTNLIGLFGSNSAVVIDMVKNPETFVEKIHPFRMIFNYNVEKHADSFAVDYGYGIHLASALKKLRVAENSLKSKVVYPVTGINWAADFWELQVEIISSMLSGYPHEQNRIRTALDRLERSSKDSSLDPRTRKELEGQLKLFNEYYYNDYLSMKEDSNKQRVIRVLYMNAVEKIFGGKLDLRELVHAMDPAKRQ